MTPFVPHKPIVPGEYDYRYHTFSMVDFIEFWEYAFKKRRVGLILYPLVTLSLLLCYYQLVQLLSGNVLSMNSWMISLQTIVVFVMFFFGLSSLSGQYLRQFKTKLRPDIPEKELKRLIHDMIGKALEQGSVIITIILMTCVCVYMAAKGLAMSAIMAWVLVGGTGFNLLLLSFIIASMSKYNREFLRKAHIDEDYLRYTSLKNYKNIFLILGVVDLLVVTVLVANQLLGS